MDGITIKKKADGIGKSFEQMLKNANGLSAYLNRVVYRQYQNFQRTRWMTENASEGDKWKPLSPAYKRWKHINLPEYPGAGGKMLIAKGRLYQSAIGPGADHRKIVTKNTIKISVTTPYADYVAQVRPFMEFGRASIDDIKKGVKEYMKHLVWK